MSRPSIPRIDPQDLRDHADPARVDRVWERVEHDLPSFEHKRRGRANIVYFAAAAAFAMFGAGLFAGKTVWNKPTVSVIEPRPSTGDRALVDVLAAGFEQRMFQLPGGGKLTLQPGSTVELERGTGNSLTIKLVQGEAFVDVGDAGALASIVAGDARLNAQSGSAVTVRKIQDDPPLLGVSVAHGNVSLFSPSGSHNLGRGEHRVELRPVVASAPQNTPRPRAPLPLLPVHPKHAAKKPSAAALPEWVVLYNANDNEGAYALLKAQPNGIEGAINAARSASELMSIRDVSLKKGDNESAQKALFRVVADFPNDQNAPMAAKNLATMYQKAGREDLAKQYSDMEKRLASKADAHFCNQKRDDIRAETDKEKIAQLVKEYLDQYPNGQCKAEFERVLRPEEPAAPPDPPAAPNPR